MFYFSRYVPFVTFKRLYAPPIGDNGLKWGDNAQRSRMSLMKRDECKKIIVKILRRVTRFSAKREMREGFDRCRYFPLTLDSVYLFGSYLKGKEEPNDVDLIVIYDELDSWENAWFWRCDIRGYCSVNTAVEKLCKGIDNEKLSVLTGTNLNQVRKIFPEDKFVYIQEAYLLWSFFDGYDLVSEQEVEQEWPTALEAVHLGNPNPERMCGPIQALAGEELQVDTHSRNL